MIIERAEREMVALTSAIEAHMQELPLVIETDRATGSVTVFFESDPVVPREWGLDFGQLMNHARTGLDYLVYALALQTGERRDRDRTAFPIFEHKDRYWAPWGRGTRRTTVRDNYLAGVDERWKQKIDAVQPFHYGTAASQNRLAVLSDGANTHKHRQLQLARPLIETPGHVVFATGDDQSLSDFRVSYTPGTTDLSLEVQVQYDQGTTRQPELHAEVKSRVGQRHAIGVVFGQAPRPIKLGQAIEAIAYVREIVKWIAPAFD